MSKKAPVKSTNSNAKVKAKDLAPDLSKVVKGGKAIASTEQDMKSSRESARK